MSHSLVGADRPTHIRTVAVGVAVAAVFVGALFAARVGDPESPLLTANAPPVMKAEKAVVWTNHETGAAFR